MSIFKKYVVAFIPTIFIAVTVLRWYALEFVYRTPAKMWSGSPVTYITTLFLVLVVLVIVYFITKPFDELIKKINKGYEPSVEERNESLSVYSKIKIVTIVVNLIGFFIGQIAVIIMEVSMGLTEYNLTRIIFTVLQAVSVGSVSAFYTIFTFNEMISSQREMLKIRNVDDFNIKKPIAFSFSLGGIFILSLIHMSINTMCVGYGIIDFVNTAPVSEPLGAFLKGGILVFFTSFLPCLSLIYNVLSGLRKRISRTQKQIEQIAKAGDLKAQINIIMFDDFGSLNASINSFINQISLMISKIREGTNVVSDSANILTSTVDSAAKALLQMNQSVSEINEQEASQDTLIQQAHKDILSLTDGVYKVQSQVESQAASMEQSSSAVTQMAANINSVANMTQKAGEVSDKLSFVSEQGNESLTKAVGAVSAIQTASLEVQEIVKSIQAIASQTNLLSMNAAIEAAHAGSFGAGFAVVADEVRSLATSSANSAKDIQKRIKDMVKKVMDGVEAIQEAGNAFSNIKINIEENTNLIRKISQAMSEQSSGASETMTAANGVLDSIDMIKQLTESQTEFAKKVQEAMQKVVESSVEVAKKLDTTTQSTENLESAIKNVESMSVKNSVAVNVVTESIKVFKV